MTKKEKITSIVALALLAAAVVALAILLLTREKPVELRTKTFVNEYFNTVSTIYCYAEETDEGFAEKCRAVEELLKEYHKLSDIYNDYDGKTHYASELVPDHLIEDGGICYGDSAFITVGGSILLPPKAFTP